jgi:electron transport complex protein RnfB
MINTVLVMLALGSVLGLVLAIGNKVFFVKEDERTAKVIELLPGYNCGACGYPGCSGLAAALVSGEVTQVICKPAKLADKELIAEYLNQSEGPNGEILKVKA